MLSPRPYCPSAAFSSSGVLCSSAFEELFLLVVESFRGRFFVWAGVEVSGDWIADILGVARRAVCGSLGKRGKGKNKIHDGGLGEPGNTEPQWRQL